MIRAAALPPARSPCVECGTTHLLAARAARGCPSLAEFAAPPSSRWSLLAAWLPDPSVIRIPCRSAIATRNPSVALHAPSLALVAAPLVEWSVPLLHGRSSNHAHTHTHTHTDRLLPHTRHPRANSHNQISPTLLTIPRSPATLRKRSEGNLHLLPDHTECADRRSIG